MPYLLKRGSLLNFWLAPCLQPLVLGLICTLTLGVYYGFDNPAALPDEFTVLAGNSTFRYELLYSCYALPNVLLRNKLATLELSRS